MIHPSATGTEIGSNHKWTKIEVYTVQCISRLLLHFETGESIYTILQNLQVFTVKL